MPRIEGVARKTTKEENEIFAHVGPGTPLGETFRRYWWAVGISEDLKDKPTYIRVLCEDLVLWREAGGKPALLGSRCSHRRTNLCFGTVESNGLRCRHHGWLYDPKGVVLETPGEADESFRKSIKHVAYPTQELGGMIFAYFGPEPAPILPKYDMLAGEGSRHAFIQGVEAASWLAVVENGLDPVHSTFLHRDMPTMKERDWREEVAGEETWFEPIITQTSVGPVELGICYIVRRPRKSGSGDLIQVHGQTLPAFNVSVGRWATPIDDTHTLHVRVAWRADGRDPGKGMYSRVPVVAEPYKEYLAFEDLPVEERNAPHPELGYSQKLYPRQGEQDASMLISQGGMTDRENENLLPHAEVGVSVLRQKYLDMIEDVRAGRDPIGVIRNEALRDEVLHMPRKWPLYQA
jgi:5,5'-dehydrodivanillate O-demethylase oxygenase subunit